MLLHGFPSSSHQYRDLIPKLTPDYHVVAADMPEFGYSDQPAADRFECSFAHLTEIMDHALDLIGLKKYSIYVID